MKRRSFLQWMGLGWLVTAVQGCFARSGGGQGTSQGASGGVVVGSVSDLAGSGVLERNTALGPVLVTGDAASPESLRAVNPTCTHQGCTVRWQPQQQEFLCPCHGARFAADGAVLQGPAGAGLKAYSVRVEGTEVLVDA
ncbi:MAG: ubiquinol-cytochrome c reductase iron-sulfur subunit [Cyanobacteria bacterium Co-bin13]|nr:ubiquinol-cytochrome c reductase iron-sulfur subunit [Cyanobacteria bacterium Co-bin13]